MAKKVFLVLVLAAVAAGGVFAQEGGGKKMALSLDLAPTLRGFVASQAKDKDKGQNEQTYIALSPVFEYAIGNYSIGARVDLVFGTEKIASGDKTIDGNLTHFGLAVMGRWYPLSPLEKLYIGTELGFDTATVKIDDMNVDEEEYTGLTFALRAGWKHIMGPVFLEPSLGYVFSKSASGSYAGKVTPITPQDWEIGLNFGLAF